MFPSDQGFANFRGFAGWAEFPDERAVFRKKLEQGRVVKRTTERRPVIARWPLDIVHVAADQVR